MAFKHVAVCGLDLEGFEVGTGKSLVSDFPPLFIEKYVGAGLHATDPLISEGMVGRKAVTDNTAGMLNPMPQELRDLLSFFEIRDRALVPIRRQDRMFGAVIFTKASAFSEDDLIYLEFIGRPLYETIVQPVMERFAVAELQLTAGEVTCLRHAELGLTSEEIAAECGYARQTVNAYILSATRKLKANNRTHAIATALRKGLLG